MRSLDQVAKLVQRAMLVGDRQVHKVQGFIEAIYKKSRRQVELLDQVSRTIEIDGKSHLEGIREEISQQQNRMSDLTKDIERQSNFVQQLLKATTKLKQTSGILEVIAVESRLLSVNAKVQSASIAKESRSIQVIATAIRDLSQSLDRCSEDLDEVITNIRLVVPSLVTQSETARKSSAEMEESMSRLMDIFAKQQSGLSKRIDTAFENSRKSAKAATLDAHEILAVLQGFDETSQLLNAALTRIDDKYANHEIGTPERLLEPNPVIEVNEVEDDLVFL